MAVDLSASSSSKVSTEEILGVPVGGRLLEGVDYTSIDFPRNYYFGEVAPNSQLGSREVSPGSPPSVARESSTGHVGTGKVELSLEQTKQCAHNDAHIACALANSAVAVQNPAIMELVPNPYEKLKNCMVAMGAAIEKCLTSTPPIALTKGIIEKVHALCGRYVPGATIGSLYSEDADENAVKRANDSLSAALKNTPPLELNRLAELLKTELKELNNLLNKATSFNGPEGLVSARAQEFRTVQFLAGMGDFIPGIVSLASSQSDAAAILEALKAEPNSSLKVEEQSETVNKLMENEYFYEFPMRGFDENLARAIVAALPASFNEEDKRAIESLVSSELKASREIATGNEDKVCGGMRGRTVAANVTGNLAARDKTKPSFVASCVGDVDDLVWETLGKQDSLRSFFSGMAGNHAFAHTIRPGQFANGYMLPSTRVDIINNPLGYLKNLLGAQNYVSRPEDAVEPSKKQALKAKLEGLDESVTQSMQRSILDSKLPKVSTKTGPEGKSTFETVKDLLSPSGGDSYASKPNLASAIKDNKLRTLCSVSGTTIDIISALHTLSADKTKGALSSLKQFVEKKLQLSDEFKSLFLSIAVYMQSGQYHTAAEVLCGLYCSALTLLNDPPEMRADVEVYSSLMKAFQENPESFFPSSENSTELVPLYAKIDEKIDSIFQT